MSFEPEITQKRTRPTKIRSESDVTPENLEKIMLWIEDRLNGVETQIADHETRITNLE